MAGLLFPIPISVINNSPSPKISNTTKEKESSSPAKSPKKGTLDNSPSSDKLKTYHKNDLLFFIKSKQKDDADDDEDSMSFKSCESTQDDDGFLFDYHDIERYPDGNLCYTVNDP